MADSRSSRWWRQARAGAWLPPLIALGVVALGWQWYADRHPFVLPRLPQVFEAMADRPGFFARNALTTGQETAVGAACGMGAAFVLAVVMSRVRVVDRAVMPLAVILNVTPLVAIAPCLVVAFGFGLTPKYILAAVIVFFPFLINALIGLRSVDPHASEVLRTVNASPWEMLWRLQLPSSLPFLLAAARICLPLSVTGAVVAEFSAAGEAKGLGTLSVTAASLSDLDTLYASVFILAALGILVTVAVVLVQRALLRRYGAAEIAGTVSQ